MTSSPSPELELHRSYVAIIPARGGSKGIPNKTLAPLAGRPLLDHTVLAAKEASRVDGVFVTTEDAEIAAQAWAGGAATIGRPAGLSEDHVAMHDVLLHALEALRGGGAWGARRDPWFVLLQPTSPLRTGADIDGAIAHLEANGGRGVVSVLEEDPEIYKYMTVGDDGFLRGLVSSEAPFMRRQDCPPIVRPNGAIYVYRVSAFEEAGGFYFDGVLPYPMPPDRSVDIDRPEDLLAAEEALAS